MSIENLILCVFAGIAIGSVAWLPLALMSTQTPKAGMPLTIKLTADVRAHQEAIRKSMS